MKKLIILLAAVLAVGGAGLYMLSEHSGLQKELPTSYEAENEEDTDTDGKGADISAHTPQTLSVVFSHTGTFYDSAIEVELFCADENAIIYYTTDGNDPDTSDKHYSAPIKLNAKAESAVTTIKAVAVSGEQTSETFVKSYVVGRDVMSRFDDETLVFILSADEYDLYDYYNGIAVEGYLRDKYLEEEYKGGEIIPTDPANYNIRGRESERKMYVEVYNSRGEQLISQLAGARVVGGYSRANDQKSWRLIARNSYSEGNGKFKYPFFPGDRDAYGNLLTRYDRVTLRDGANDREFAGLRDELSMTLAAQAGVPDTQAVRPAAVFLNSEYYGFAWLHEAYSDDYLEMMYGGNKDNFRIVGSEELFPESDDEEDAQAVSDWERVLSLAANDLNDERYFSEFCELVDIDDLMLYYAIQVYIDNKDWPGNNFKVWRYYPAESEEITSPYLDGRWRFMLFDAEFGWGLYGNGYRDDTLEEVLSGNHMKGYSQILRGLLTREDMRERFANTMCELYSGVFSQENVQETLDKLIEQSDPELMYALNNGYVSGWANEWTFADSRDQISEFAARRPAVMKRSLASHFGYSGDTYNVSFRAPNGAKTFFGSQELKTGEELSVDYFIENGVVFSVEPYDGFSFERWEVNGAEYDMRELRVDASMCDENGNIEIRLFLSRTEKTSGIRVSELYTAGDEDWIELCNFSGDPMNIKGWHLSDKASQPDKYVIPDVTIPAGETVTFVCKDNSGQSALMRHQTNFSLKTGETLYFSDADMNIISVLPVLEMDKQRSLSLGVDGLYYESAVTEGIYIE